MTYRLDKSKTRRKYFVIGTGIIVFLTAVFFWASVKKIMYTMLEPSILRFATVKEMTEHFPQIISLEFASKQEIVAENTLLSLEIERLENKVAEHDAFRREIGYMQDFSTTTESIVMYPIIRDRSTLYATILLSKGDDARLAVGDIVYLRGMQPVCRIRTVYAKTSLCSLLSKSGEITEAVIIPKDTENASSTSIAITLTGEGNGFSAIVPKEVALSVGDSVFLASDQSLRIGEVVSISKDIQAIGYKVYVKGVYNPLTSVVFFAKQQ